jgi:26S proteasome regulatory subunit N5
MASSLIGPELAKKDYSEELQVLIPESVLVANTRGIDEALQLLLALEKKCRAHNDTHTLKALCLHMVRLCRERNDWLKLNSTLSVIDKRRNQSKFAVSAVVEEALQYIDQTPSKEIKIELIRALKAVCEGKMYLEAESARLHLMLALIWEADGNIAGACEIIQVRVVYVICFFCN